MVWWKSSSPLYVFKVSVFGVEFLLLLIHPIFFGEVDHCFHIFRLGLVN